MKKNILLLTLATSTLLLSSCGKITVEFPNGDTPLTSAPISLDHNTLDVIYDSIKNSDNYESDINSILSNALAIEVIGNFYVVADETNGFNVVLDGYDTEGADKNAFIASHPAYNNWDVSGYRLTLSETTPSQAEFDTRIASVKKIIENEIVSTLWGQANATSYKRNNRFYEVLFARNIYEQLYSINISQEALGGAENTLENVLYTNPKYDDHYILDEKGDFIGFNDSIQTENGFTKGALIDGSFNTTTEEGIEKIKSVLHFDYYIEYINQTIMPEIIQNLLVEQYIFEQQYTAIGNTQSRKVNYITIADNAEKDAPALFNSFIKKFVTDEDKTENAGLEQMSTADEYAILETAWKGIAFETAENENAKLLANGQFDVPTTKNPSAGLDGHVAIDDENNSYNSYYQIFATTEANEKYFSYYKNTPYADLIEQYSTLTNDPQTNNAENFTTFTSIDSHNYDPNVGFAIKTDELRVADYTTNDWQTKSESSLPDAIKNKLYSFGFVNEWNNAIVSENAYRGSYIYQSPVSKKSYLRKDAYSNTIDSILWNDGDNYYLVEIEDIVTPNLVAISNDDDAATKVEREEKARLIGYSLASGDTYTTNAITYYLEQCNINYHDQDVYDYFASTYPDLFD